ncbi:phosphoribosyltransferase family protein [Planomonospora parontospora]|uniref:phosphoribosyltransferase family protein n=1 Tax=Planomonospora parontospora TaxID=58119 RepID=UPI001670E210|nr:phosphoribosyltransferase family protein [Planomonospora parontospora]GGL07554.1 putative phosphoribosyl transferase [Planomonospora parontospora subsp. antibiotica]GII14638.1 putative phosphoribosyl transferase [Planomonospora parontospora subsp. antibiotica]
MFFDRHDAGTRLAERLRGHAGGAGTVVVGLPRGGVPVASEVARVLGAPLDVIVVRKLGVPVQPELGFGAIGEGGVRVVNDDVVRAARLTAEEMARVEEAERAELERRARRFRGDRPPVALEGRTVIVVDDGIATGGTARAACRVARAHGASRVVLAVPVGAPEAIESLRGAADEVVCLLAPDDLFAIGAWYRDFDQTSDAQVVELLRRAASMHAAASGTGGPGRDAVGAGGPGRDAVGAGGPGRDAARSAAGSAAGESAADGSAAPGGNTAGSGAGGRVPAFTAEVQADAGDVRLPGRLAVPDAAAGTVVFVHGSGSSRHSPRNRQVATALYRAGLAVLLFDLLTPGEELDRGNVFDVPLLAGRLDRVTGWLRGHPGVRGLRVAYFGASTGAAAALWAAAEPGADIAAVVSRGGRPDLAGPRLPAVRAATLLVVGGNDEAVLELNRAAQRRLHCENSLRIVPGATHLFEEPGALETVSEFARDWFTAHLAPVARR